MSKLVYTTCPHPRLSSLYITTIWEEQKHIIEFLHIIKHCAIGSAAFQEKGGTIVQYRDSSGHRLKCWDCSTRIGMVGNYDARRVTYTSLCVCVCVCVCVAQLKANDNSASVLAIASALGCWIIFFKHVDDQYRSQVTNSTCLSCTRAMQTAT